MGTIYNRGSRSKPRWYIRFKDADGRYKSRPSHQPTKAQARRYLGQVEARIASGKVGIEQPSDEPPCSEIMLTWGAQLQNRNAQDDRGRLRRHVLPAFRHKRITEIDLPVIMAWLDAQRAAGKLAEQSIRHNLNLLSRFFSWAIERGHAQANPVRQIPVGKRPQQSQKVDVPWLDDDKAVRLLLKELPVPIREMFYLGNRSGLRTGEICGLRLADLGYLDEGVIRVRFSYDGPIKEDKQGLGKVKWVPAATDCEVFLTPWLETRKAADARSTALVFPSPRNPVKPCGRRYVERYWDKAREALGFDLTWYQATRHSFTSRLLAAGASLDEVSAALGHSSPVVTRRYYDHFVRRSYSSQLRVGLGLEGK